MNYGTSSPIHPSTLALLSLSRTHLGLLVPQCRHRSVYELMVCRHIGLWRPVTPNRCLMELLLPRREVFTYVVLADRGCGCETAKPRICLAEGRDHANSLHLHAAI